MDGLPFLPGFRFDDVTKKYHNLSSQFQWKNGYALPKDKSIGIGNDLLDVDSILYSKTLNGTCYNPALTYGKAKEPPRPIVQPHFTLFYGKCLSFNGYTIQTETESPLYTYRVRLVKITYYLVDDTISVSEPVVENAGYVQGCLLKRDRVPNPYRKNRTWHWSDLNNGAELSLHGIKYRLCSCDAFTRRFLSSQGVAVNADEPLPDDPYMTARRQRRRQPTSNAMANNCSGSSRQPVEDHKLKQFLENDRKVLRFYGVWNVNESEPAEWKYFVILYFLADDRVEINESKTTGNICNQNPFPLFLGKIKLPKSWSNLPAVFPSTDFELDNKGCQEYYQPKDFIIGNTIFVMGRKFILYDCDPFTRNYFKEILKVVQPDPIEIKEPTISYPTNEYKKIIPPHTGIGDPDDTRQNCLSLIPKPPKTVDFVKYVLNASKKLRYKLKMVTVYEVDNHRDFVMEFCLGNDQMVIYEVVNRNSGFIKGRFLSSIRLRKPGFSIDENQFYGTKDFFIGAELHVKGTIFKIVELDLWTYNYMVENKHMFTQDAINEAKSYLESKGLLETQVS